MTGYFSIRERGGVRSSLGSCRRLPLDHEPSPGRGGYPRKRPILDVPCNLTESQEMNLPASITRD